MIKNKKSLKGSKTPSRRKFFKAAAATGAAAATAVAMPNVAFGAPLTLKMQAAWPSGANIFFEMAGDYAKMGDFTIKSKVTRETVIPTQNVKLHVPAEKCCVYEDNKLI